MKGSFQTQNLGQGKTAPPPTLPPTTYKKIDLKGFALKRDVHELKNAIDSKSSHPVLDEFEKQKAAVTEKLNAAENAIHALSEGWNELKSSEKTRLENLPREVAETALFLAEKIIQQEIHVNPAVVVNTVEALVAETSGEKDRKLFLNREDVDFLKAEKPEVFSKIEALPNLTIVVDQMLPRGSCRVETPASIVDGSYFKRLESLWNKFMEGGE